MRSSFQAGRQAKKQERRAGRQTYRQAGKTRGTCAKKAQEVWAPKKLSSFKPQNTERLRFWSTNPYNAEIFLHKPLMGKTIKNG